jgi:hypothetical protein
MPNYGYTTAGTGNQTIGVAHLQALQAFPEAGTLDSVTVEIGVDAGDARVAVYAGGTANNDTDPTGATLVVDLGLIGGTTTGLRTLLAGGQALTAGTRYWLAIKSDDAASYRTRKTDATIGGNFAAAVRQTTGEPAAEGTAWSATIGAGTVTNTAASFTWYLTYTAGGGGGGSAKRLIGGSLIGRGKTFGRLI